MRFKLLIISFFVSVVCFAQKHYPLKNMFGVNVHQWDIWYYSYPQFKGAYDAKIKALTDYHPSSLRVYLDADLLQDPYGNYAINPSYRGGWQTDDGLKRLKSALPDLFVQACYQRQSLFTLNEWTAAGVSNSQINFAWQYNNDVDRVKPSSYTRQSHDLAVLTTRGGRNTNAPGYNVYTNPSAPWTNNFVVKGLNIYDAIENGNEWNGWWGNYNTNMSSAGMAAAWKNGWDSVKKIDPSMQFTNGGIASDIPDTLLKAIDYWTKNGYGVPVDYFSYHSYPSALGQYGWGIFGGLNPEEILYKKAKDMVTVIGSIKPVVIGEWGYDLHPDSWQNAPAFSTYTAEQTRAYWSSRAVLKFDQAGICRAQWYRAYQDYYPNDPRGGYYQSDNNSTQFSQMALFRQTNDTGNVIYRTLVGDCFKQINDAFGDYTFYKAIRDDSLQVLIFNNGINYLYACWAVEPYNIINSRPVYTERKFNYQFNFSGTRYDLNEDGSGVLRSSPFYGGNVQLSTKPFFIVSTTILPVRDKPQPKPKPHQKYTVEVQDIFGQTLMIRKDVEIESFRAEVNRSYLANGFYILKYMNGKEVIHEKFIKQ